MNGRSQCMVWGLLMLTKMYFISYLEPLFFAQEGAPFLQQKKEPQKEVCLRLQQKDKIKYVAHCLCITSI